MIGAYATSKYTFDLHPEDVYFCTADCGWITGPFGKKNRRTGAFGRAGPKTKTKMEEQKRRITKQIHPKILNAKTPERSF